jgi:hypothetical protein
MPSAFTLTGLAFLAIAGCQTGRGARAVDHDLGSVPSSAARVCIIRPETRPNAYVGIASDPADVTIEARDNDRLVGATRGATFVCWLVAPGDHQITSADDDTGPTLLRARAGQHYWLHQEVTALEGEVHAHLDWIDDATAAEMLDECTARVRVAVPGHDDRTDTIAVAPRL